MNEPYFKLLKDQAAGIPNATVRITFDRLIELHRELMATAAKIRGDNDLTAQGRINKGRDEGKKIAWKVIRAKAFAARLNERINEKSAKIELPPFDKADVAGAHLRSQVRERLPKSAKEIKALVPTMSLLYLQTLLEAPELVGADRETAEAARIRAIDIVHPGKLDELERERAAVQLLANATSAAANAMRELAELPNAHALNDFLNQAVPDQRHIQADVERETNLAAA
ncbi:hypothetical protein GA0061098_1007151 [Bradyrhizobium shewense]|uniref:Uncharacterized protein n=1 Tax=Bradyrhizobium shewense TaxID=1761772 RepID=A0A1C3WC28_9BRAD|nr:hypothetical protein [Bradyrhizobium shewense]SCB37609.1 hypothetical protein GA0061098_1007151 [Bradyrhizobium shewense]